MPPTLDSSRQESHRGHHPRNRGLLHARDAAAYDGTRLFTLKEEE